MLECFYFEMGPGGVANIYVSDILARIDIETVENWAHREHRRDRDSGGAAVFSNFLF